MTSLPPRPLISNRRWALWLGGLALMPLAGATAAIVYFGLYRSFVTGKITATSKGWTGSSSVIAFADSPVWFVISWILTALMAAGLIVTTVILARLILSRRRVDQ